MSEEAPYLLLLTAAASWLLTWALRQYALQGRLLDVPNERSSHATPTPRGGGVAIVVSFVAGVVYLWSSGLITPGALIALAGAGAWVALVGFIDDHGHVPARWRLLAHGAGAALALYGLGGLPPVRLLGADLDLGLAAYVLGAVFLVWLLNLYNFMDGIDGIAGIEAVTVGVGGALLYQIAFPGTSAWLVPALLAAAAAGFLAWNAPPARIFMGDAGSGFLGLCLGVLSLQAAHASPALLWAWLILLGVFVVDATVTLVRRAASGKKLHEAHRTHAYQHAARRFGRHRPVTLAVAVINVAWLGPIACWVASGRIDGVFGLTVAYAPLVVLALRFGAGAPEPQGRGM